MLHNTIYYEEAGSIKRCDYSAVNAGELASISHSPFDSPEKIDFSKKLPAFRKGVSVSTEEAYFNYLKEAERVAEEVDSVKSD